MALPTPTDVLIIGGSYAGLAAAMTLGRSLRHVVVLDSGLPCNRQTPYAHNFLTRDGETPAAIRARAREQVLAYPTVTLVAGLAVAASRQEAGFLVTTADGSGFQARKLIFATGVHDQLLTLPGFADCWGISVLHCPYCHGYEVHGQPLAVLGNGDAGFEFARLLRQWTPHLTLLTNGASTLTGAQRAQLHAAGVLVEEEELAEVEHSAGQLHAVWLGNGQRLAVSALFARVPFVQHSALPAALGCRLTEPGHLQIDELHKTSVPGIYAAGDATTPMRTVAVAVAAGMKAGSFVNHELIQEQVW